jgi:hypothetical protein
MLSFAKNLLNLTLAPDSAIIFGSGGYLCEESSGLIRQKIRFIGLV